MARPTERLTEIVSTAARTIERYRLLSPADRVLVAFSGGADSTAAAIILQRLGYPIVLGHVDHRMRGDSAKDADRCALTADRLGVEFHGIRLEVAPATEETARTARYEALEQIRSAVGAKKIATGHTMDDQAETVAMRLERGGFGLGMPAARGRLVRPLLDVRRADTEFVCDKLAVEYLIDPSNADEYFTRNRIRRRLRAEPEGVIQGLVELDAANRALVDRTRADIARLVASIGHREGAVMRFDRSALTDLPDAMLRALIRHALDEQGVLASPRLLDDVIAKVIPVTGAGLDASAEVDVWSEPGWLAIGRWKASDLPELRLDIPGAVSSHEWGIEVSAEVTTPPAHFDGSDEVEYFAADAIAGPVTIRQWRPGDRMVVLGSKGAKKLQDLFVDLKVPRRHRDSVPVVACGEEIVWVVGHRIADPFKVTASTSRVVRLEVSRSMRL